MLELVPPLLLRAWRRGIPLSLFFYGSQEDMEFFFWYMEDFLRNQNIIVKIGDSEGEKDFYLVCDNAFPISMWRDGEKGEKEVFFLRCREKDLKEVMSLRKRIRNDYPWVVTFLFLNDNDGKKSIELPEIPREDDVPPLWCKWVRVRLGYGYKKKATLFCLNTRRLRVTSQRDLDYILRLCREDYLTLRQGLDVYSLWSLEDTSSDILSSETVGSPRKVVPEELALFFPEEEVNAFILLDKLLEKKWEEVVSMVLLYPKNMWGKLVGLISWQIGLLLKAKLAVMEKKNKKEAIDYLGQVEPRLSRYILEKVIRKEDKFTLEEINAILFLLLEVESRTKSEAMYDPLLALASGLMKIGNMEDRSREDYPLTVS